MTTVTIDNIVIRGATRANQTGGWQAPEETVDRGLDYSSFVRPTPLELTLEAWVDSATLSALERIRQDGEPFSASVGTLGFPEAKLEELSVEDTGDSVQHPGGVQQKGFQITFRMEEIHFAETDTAEVQFETEAGDNMSSSAEDSQPSSGGSEESSSGMLSGVSDSLGSAADSMASSLGL